MPKIVEIINGKAVGKDVPEFGQTFKDADFPKDMRRQLWPLCCGASILSGLKDIQLLKEDELAQQIIETIDENIPDFQVFQGEVIRPKLTWLTLNSDQMKSKKIMGATEKAGFKLIGTAKPRGATQGFFIRDLTETWQSA